jgi:hypothetical protein
VSLPVAGELHFPATLERAVDKPRAIVERDDAPAAVLARLRCQAEQVVGAVVPAPPAPVCDLVGERGELDCVETVSG